MRQKPSRRTKAQHAERNGTAKPQARATKPNIEALKQAAPPVPKAEARATNFLYRMMEGMTDELADVCRQNIDKRTRGQEGVTDEMYEAAKDLRGFALEIHKAEKKRVSASKIGLQQNAHLIINGSAFDSDIRKHVAALIVAEGPQDDRLVAKRLGLLHPRVVKALDHDWFECDPDGWKLTPKGEAALAEQQ